MSKNNKWQDFLIQNKFIYFRCGKLLKDADAATAHAMKTNHSSFSECTDVIKPLTAEEKEEMKKKLELTTLKLFSNFFIFL